LTPNDFKGNTQVFIDFSIGKRKSHRVIFELFEDKVPRTAKNFLSLIRGFNGQGYKGSKVHRIVPGFVIQGGDFTRGDGSGGHSIYGKYFEDECFDLKHDEPGLLSMANCGPNTNGSQFFITLEYLPHLNDKHVVFGRVIKGMNFVKEMERFGSEEGTPKETVKIVNCGVESQN